MRSMSRRFSLALLAGIIGAPAAMAQNVTLEVTGDCPGTINLRWTGAEPNRQMAILFGERLGLSRSVRVCEGTWLGMSGIRLVRVIPTRSNGSGTVSGEAMPNACGGYLQIMVLNDSYVCQTSNVVQIPE